MTPETRTRARQIFLDVCDLEPVARAARISELCGGDESLKELVDALLREDPGTKDTGFAPVVSGASVEGLAAALLEAPGSMIGPYRIVRLLGEGGFGTVYLAQQDVPISRRVALKVVKLGMDTRQVVARFEQERQSLASMDHPNIAKVYDAGATSNGRPYFAMEYCEGESITRYCDTNKLSVGARLSLFAQVCLAVQHAHQKGLIHRDLKPGNVLISQVDGAPVAKVIDFGIAKATMREETGASVFTQHGQFVGTPEYMSPEQAAGSGDIDTRADIYALGVMLYELLTGSTPFDSKSLRAAAYDEIRRIIREVDPPRPSTKLRESGDTATRVAEARQSEPRRLGGLLSGELDWVVMKSLEKNRDRRYSSAAEFAADIERYLRDEPVSARPTTGLYRMAKFARRNKGLVVAAGMVTASLLLGMMATTAMYLRAEGARGREESERRRAETKSATTQAINDFLIKDLLAAPNPWVEEGRDVKVSETLDRAAGRVGERFGGLPEVEAAVRTTLGRSYSSLGLVKPAMVHHQRAVELRRAGTGDAAEVAESIRLLASSMSDAGDHKEAEPLCRDALERFTALSGASSDRVADTLEVLANIQMGLSEYKGADETLGRAIGIREALGADAENKTAMARLTHTRSNVLALMGDYAGAEKMMLRAIEMFTAATGAGSPHVAQVRSDLGSLYFEMDKYAESEAAYNASLPVMIAVLGPEHPLVLLNRRSLANTISYMGRDAEAEPIFLESIAISERTLGKSHPQTMAAVNSLATMYLRLKKYDQAEPLLEGLFELSLKEMGEKHAETLKYAVNLAWCERYRGNAAEAETHFRMGVDGFRETLGKTHPYTISAVSGLAQFLASEKRWKESADQDRLMLEYSKEAGWPEDGDTARILSRMGLNLIRAGEPAAAREPLARSLELCRKLFPPADWRTGTAEMRMGECLSLLGEHEAGEALLLAALKKLREDPGTAPGNKEACLGLLRDHYTRTGQTEKAAEIEAQLPK
jgi:serine/threonine protein kinase